MKVILCIDRLLERVTKASYTYVAAYMHMVVLPVIACPNKNVCCSTLRFNLELIPAAAAIIVVLSKQSGQHCHSQCQPGYCYVIHSLTALHAIQPKHFQLKFLCNEYSGAIGQPGNALTACRASLCALQQLLAFIAAILVLSYDQARSGRGALRDFDSSSKARWAAGRANGSTCMPGHFAIVLHTSQVQVPCCCCLSAIRCTVSACPMVDMRKCTIHIRSIPLASGNSIRATFMGCIVLQKLPIFSFLCSLQQMPHKLVDNSVRQPSWRLRPSQRQAALDDPAIVGDKAIYLSLHIRQLSVPALQDCHESS